MSFYLLELSLIPGDLVKRDFYVYEDINYIFKTLQNDLSTGQGCYEAAWYGETIKIYVYENYQLIKTIDMHPYIFFETDEYPHIYYGGNNEVIAIDKNDVVITKDTNNSEFDQYFFTEVLNNRADIMVHLKMPNIPILTGIPVTQYQQFNLTEYPGVTFHYGYNDLEFGNHMMDDTSTTEMSIDLSSDDETSF